MKRPNVIIITTSTQESIDIHNHMDDTSFEEALRRPENQYPIDCSWYDKQWIWWFDKNGSFAGASVQGGIETAVRRNPGAEIFLMKDFMKKYPKKQKIESKKTVTVHCGESIHISCIGRDIHPVKQVERAIELLNSDKDEVAYSNNYDFISAVKWIGKKKGIKTEFFLNGKSQGDDIENIFGDLNRALDMIGELGAQE